MMGLTRRPSTDGMHVKADEEADGGLDEEAIERRCARGGEGEGVELKLNTLEEEEDRRRYLRRRPTVVIFWGPRSGSRRR
jgi:hypothetical protein